MSEYIDETSLTDEEVAEAIAAAKAKKAERARKLNEEKARNSGAKLEKKSLDDESSEALLNESSSAAQMEEDEDESPAVRSAKSFSNAFAEAKKKREQELLRKREERRSEPEDDEEEDEEEQDDDSSAAVIAADDDEDDAEFETDGEDEEDEEYEDEDSDEEYDEEYEEDDDDDSEYDEYDEDEEDEDDGDDSDFDGIFETDDENSEYNNTVDVDEDDGDEDDDDEEDEDDDDESTFSTKTKVIIGIIITILVIAIIAAIAFFMKSSGEKPNDTSSVAVAADGDVTSVKFAESSVSIQVGETVDLKLIVEPENASDKTFKLKSNDDTIAKVNEKGQVIGIASGSTTVTATLKSNPTMTASLVVNVIDEEQSALNTYNKFINDILEGTTDIEPVSDVEEDEETDSDEENSDSEADTDSESDTDSETKAHGPSHVLSGNKIDDFDSDGSLELALYYQPNTDNEEPLVRIFHLVSETEEEETDSEEEEEQLYDEYGNPIESEETDSEEETETESETEKAENTAPAPKKLAEVEEYSELYMTCYSAIEADSATNPWNTCYLEVKEDEQVTARVKILSDGYTAPTYTFESEDEEIATVDKQGNIKGVKPGTVFITISSPLNSDAVAKVKVRVKDDTDLLDDYLADIPVVNNTNDNIFPTETLTGKAIVDIDNDGMSELLLRFRLSDNVEVINLIKVENEKCVCYKTYNNLSDLYEYNDGSGSYSNSILIHYTTGKVCMEYKAVVAKEGSKSKTSEEKILTLENNGSLSELVNFRTTTDVSTKKVTSEVVVERTSSTEEEDPDSEETLYEDTDENEVESSVESETEEDSDEENTSEYVDEDNDGYDDITGVYFGSFAVIDLDEVIDNGINMAVKKPVKTLPAAVGAPDDDEDDGEDYDDTYGDDDQNYNEDNDVDSTASNDDDDDEPTTSTVTTEVSEETTKYFVNGTPVEQSVYEETLTRYSATYSVWNAWESV